MKNLRLFGFLILAFVIAGCSKDPQTYRTASFETFVVDNTDRYDQADQILQADYMFVVDVSASMGYNSGNLADVYASKREEFLGGLSSFVDTLDDDNVNYRIGFINGNVHAGRMSNLNNRGFYKNILIDSIFSPRKTDDLVEELQDLGETLNHNTNVLLEAADKVMGAKKSSFIRPGSQLIYLFVTDTDDITQDYVTSHDTDANYYAQELIEHKGTASNIPAFVNARAIVAGVNPGCDPAPYFGEEAGTKIAETAKIIENRGRAIAGKPPVTEQDVSHCILRASTEFPQLLSELAQDVSKPTNIFQLQVSNVITNTIKIYKNGSATPLPTSEWTYMSGSNAVKLHTVPPANTRIVIKYDQYFVLKGKPSDVSQLDVAVNGSSIQLSSTDGWTYNESLNRIEFHGDSVTNGATITVSY